MTSLAATAFGQLPSDVRASLTVRDDLLEEALVEYSMRKFGQMSSGESFDYVTKVSLAFSANGTYSKDVITDFGDTAKSVSIWSDGRNTATIDTEQKAVFVERSSVDDPAIYMWAGIVNGPCLPLSGGLGSLDITQSSLESDRLRIVGKAPDGTTLTAVLRPDMGFAPESIVRTMDGEKFRSTWSYSKFTEISGVWWPMIALERIAGIESPVQSHYVFERIDCDNNTYNRLSKDWWPEGFTVVDRRLGGELMVTEADLKAVGFKRADLSLSDLLTASKLVAAMKEERLADDLAKAESQNPDRRSGSFPFWTLAIGLTSVASLVAVVYFRLKLNNS